MRSLEPDYVKARVTGNFLNSKIICAWKETGEDRLRARGLVDDGQKKKSRLILTAHHCWTERPNNVVSHTLQDSAGVRLGQYMHGMQREDVSAYSNLPLQYTLNAALRCSSPLISSQVAMLTFL